jgi:hypothetical protein
MYVKLGHRETLVGGHVPYGDMKCLDFGFKFPKVAILV